MEPEVRKAEDSLDAYFAQAKCPICEEEGSWGTVNRGASVLLHEPAGGTVVQGFPTIFRFCLRCGFVRHHAVTALAALD